ncbi:MAG: hypothetical protein ABSH19_04780 [Opitutales bacterium]|jgi:hypothetical protein
MSEPGGGQVCVRLRLSAPFRELLRAIVQRVQTAVTEAPDPAPKLGAGNQAADPELLAALSEELQTGGALDARALADLLARPNFGTGDLPLEPATAEAVIRASVQVRLRLHAAILHRLSASDLGGGLEIFRLNPAEQQAYACYRLLAHLEEDLLHQIDPRLMDGN